MLDIRLGVTAGGFLPAIPGALTPVLNLTGGETDTPLKPQLNTSVFTTENGAVDTHATTDWQIATDAAFTTIIWSALASTSKTQITVNLALNETSVYYARARHNGTTFQSQYSNAMMFNTLTVSVADPAITSPAAGAIDVGEIPAIASSAFAVLGGSDTHASSDWQVANNAGFTTIVAQSLIDTVNKTNWTVPAGNLLVSTQYFVRVRHTGTAQGASGWSPVINFTTVSAFNVPWNNISTGIYDNVSFSAAAQLGASNMRPAAFSADGTKMYVPNNATGVIYQYTLPTPWSLVGVVYANKSINFSAQDVGINSVTFSANGTKLYAMGGSTKTVYQYTLSTPWDISTTSYDVIAFPVIAQQAGPIPLAFSTDGTRMFVGGFQPNRVFQYNLTTPWDLSTASYSAKFVSVPGSLNQGVSFKPDGTKMYIVDNITQLVYQYTLATPWDLSAASFDANTLLLSAQNSIPMDISFKLDGTKFYMSGNAGSTVYQYSL